MAQRAQFRTMGHRRSLARWRTRPYGPLVGARAQVSKPRARLSFRLFKRVKDSAGRWANPMFLRQRDRFLAT
jgi:hypothetical protein